MRIIKKYNNRKLYDTEESRYVSLLEIHDLVREGETIKVLTTNNEDITTDILLGAIIERGKESDTTRLSAETLTSVINSGDGTLSGFINNNTEKGN